MLNLQIDQMKEAYQFAFQHSNERRVKHVIRRNTKRSSLATLELIDVVLIRNLSENKPDEKLLVRPNL